MVGRFVISALAITLAGIVSGGFAADPPGTPVVSSEAKARWASLSPEQRALVSRRFEQWKSMAPEQRRDVDDRHVALKSVRERVLAGLGDAERSRIEGLSRRDRHRALKPHLRSHLQELRRGIQQQLGTEGAPARSYKKIRKAIRQGGLDKLRRLESEGLLAAGEADRLSQLSPWELGPEVRRISKRAILHDPPKELLLLSDDERERIMALSPEPFLREVKRLRRGGTRAKGRLPRAFEDAVRGGGGGRAGANRSSMLPKHVLRKFLGAAELDALSELPGFERRRQIHELLRDTAKEAWEDGGGQSEGWQEILDLPPGARDRRYLKVIDPTFDLSELDEPGKQSGRGKRGSRGGRRRKP